MLHLLNPHLKSFQNYSLIQNHADDSNPTTNHKQLVFCSLTRLLIKYSRTLTPIYYNKLYEINQILSDYKYKMFQDLTLHSYYSSYMGDSTSMRDSHVTHTQILTKFCSNVSTYEKQKLANSKRFLRYQLLKFG